MESPLRNTNTSKTKLMAMLFIAIFYSIAAPLILLDVREVGYRRSKKPSDRIVSVQLLTGLYPARGHSTTFVPSGIDIGDYMMNPVVLVNHASGVDSVVGKCLKITRGDHSMVADIELLVRPDDWEGDWEADRVLHLVRQGVLGVSIQCLPEIVRPAMPSEKELQPNLKIVAETGDLFEISFVSIPAYADSLPLH